MRFADAERQLFIALSDALKEYINFFVGGLGIADDIYQDTMDYIIMSTESGLNPDEVRCFGCGSGTSDATFTDGTCNECAPDRP